MTNESKDSINNVFSEMFNENWENKSGKGKEICIQFQLYSLKQYDGGTEKTR